MSEIQTCPGSQSWEGGRAGPGLQTHGPCCFWGPSCQPLGQEWKGGREAHSFSALAILRLQSIFAASRQCSQRGFPSTPITPFVLTALT